MGGPAAVKGALRRPMAALDRRSSYDVEYSMCVIGQIQSMNALRLAFVQPAGTFDPTASPDRPQPGVPVGPD
jgi:hypothetical protein